MSRRVLNVGADGKADVMILTDPIPRHLSIVSWGANDRPATSWKSAGADPAVASMVLRSPPGADVIDIGSISIQRIQAFVGETLDAWSAVISDVLSKQLSSEDRSAQVRAITSQAGARVAAFAAAVTSEKLSSAAKTYRSAGLKLPELQANTTLHGELDRRQFMAGVQQVAAALTDGVISAMQDLGGYSSLTEAILSIFGQAGDSLSAWAAAMPSGVVGISKPEVTERAGARHNRRDKDRLNQIATLVREILGEDTPENTEKSAMTITIDDLKRLASEHPVELLTAIKGAVDAAKSASPELAKKFAWGETGVDPHDPNAIVNALRQAQGGEAIAALIASAVSGVDVNSAAQGDSPQVAATMRSAFSKFVAAELKANPNGDLANAVKAAVEPSVTTAIVESLKAIGGVGPNTNLAGAGGFEMDFGIDDDEDPLHVDTPSLHGMVAG